LNKKDDKKIVERMEEYQIGLNGDNIADKALSVCQSI